MIHKKIAIAASLIIILTTIVIIYLFQTRITDPGAVGKSIPDTGTSFMSVAGTDKITPDGQPINVDGVFGCLANDSTSSVQNMSCALGIMTDDGVKYGLNSDDQMLIGSIPTGQRIQVKGIATKQPVTNAPGIIKVQSVVRL